MLDPSALRALPRICLDDVLAAAAATTRVDRKYLVPTDDVASLLGRLPAGLRLLDIDGRLTTAYRTTYFDTEDLLTCRAHVQGRRRRWKARSRLYVEDGFCRLELKVRDGSGLTRKQFLRTPAADHGRMTPVAERFFGDGLAAHGLRLPDGMLPAVQVGYERATLADPATGSRVTIDLGVRGTRDGRTVEVAPSYAVVETKGGRAPGEVDRVLARSGARPVSFSKYVASAALTDPRIPDNDVRHLVGRQLLVGGDPVPGRPDARPRTHPVELRRTA